MFDEGSQKMYVKSVANRLGLVDQRLYIYPDKYHCSKAKSDVRQVQHRDYSQYMQKPTNILVFYLKAVEGGSQLAR